MDQESEWYKIERKKYLVNLYQETLKQLIELGGSHVHSNTFGELSVELIELCEEGRKARSPSWKKIVEELKTEKLALEKKEIDSEAEHGDDRLTKIEALGYKIELLKRKIDDSSLIDKINNEYICH